MSPPRSAALLAVAVAITCAGAWSWAQQSEKPKPDAAMRAPDPTALQTADQYVLHFRYENAKVSWLGSRLVHLPQPRTTPRVAGRWALELLSGPTLIERIRFDFPGLGADELAGQTTKQHNAPPRFENRTLVDIHLMAPDSSRISRARLVDRATGKIMALPWPPVLPKADAGAEAAATRDASSSAASSSSAPPPPPPAPPPDAATRD